MTGDAPLLEEQQAYYRARAPEYDDWWFGTGAHVLPPKIAAERMAEQAALEAALERFGPQGDVLELACGTGLWTRHLVRYADTVTAVDGSPEVLAINRARVSDDRVRYVEADLFAWQPPAAAFDVAVFGFWLTHVPDELLVDFWATVRRALRGDGRVFLVDSDDHRLSAATRSREGHLMVRRLRDGREFRIVKRYWEPDELRDRLAELGWVADVARTGRFFIHATARLA